MQRTRKLSIALAALIALTAIFSAASASAAQAPVVTTEPAIGIGASEATPSGIVSPQGSNTTYQFEYGTTVSYGSKMPAAPEAIGSSIGDIPVHQNISGLAANTTYHYRVVATNAYGTTIGSDQTLKTNSTVSTMSNDLQELGVVNAFDGSPTSLANFSSSWEILLWGTEKGEDTSSGWRPLFQGPKVAATYYKTKISDSGPGIASVVTLSASPARAEHHISLWLDMQGPYETTRTGYELKITENLEEAPNVYGIILSKWVAGTKTKLGVVSRVVFPPGSSFALVDQGSTVSGWFKTGSEYRNFLSVTDSTFSSGQSGIEAEGSKTRLTNFKAGVL